LNEEHMNKNHDLLIADPKWLDALKEVIEKPVEVEHPVGHMFGGISLVEMEGLPENTAFAIDSSFFKYARKLQSDSLLEPYEPYQPFISFDFGMPMGTMGLGIALSNIGNGELIVLGYFEKLWLNIKSTFRIAWWQMNRDYKELMNE